MNVCQVRAAILFYAKNKFRQQLARLSFLMAMVVYVSVNIVISQLVAEYNN